VRSVWVAGSDSGSGFLAALHWYFCYVTYYLWNQFMVNKTLLLQHCMPMVSVFIPEKIRPKSTRVIVFFPLEFHNHTWYVLENNSDGATRPRKSLIISLSVSIQYQRVTSSQTVTRRQQSPRLRIASRG